LPYQKDFVKLFLKDIFTTQVRTPATKRSCAISQLSAADHLLVDASRHESRDGERVEWKYHHGDHHSYLDVGLWRVRWG